MTRSTSKKTALTSAPNATLTRQAKRLSRQQKRLATDMLAESSDYIPTKTSARGRAVTEKDLANIQPKTDMQADFFNTFDEADAMVIYGSAGTGKSYIALYLSLLAILDPESPYDKIVILRSTVQSRDQGFLPGEIEDKYAPFEEPYRNIVYELTNRKDAYDKLKDTGKIEFATTSFLRGITFNNSIVLFDECQNETFGNINTIMTRVGKCTKIIACGDGVQTDISKQKNDMSGFDDFIRVARTMKDFALFQFTSNDIVRSGFVRSWIMACEKLGV